MTKKIGLISDTHGVLNKGVSEFISDRDEIWHAGDIGSESLIDKIQHMAPLRAVYGNIDSGEIRLIFPKFNVFRCEDVNVLMTHIGGYPNRYDKETFKKIKEVNPDLFISGHSHILKIMYDQKNDLLHMNPGAAGHSGFHKYITAIRFEINGKEILNAEVFEKKRANR